ncbi:MAG: efflux RND transporter permease subunit, partial [Pyrinomonadaceae bacterium]|nr:efflux RND transporter permease subunit [Pyrinomonadaceae bacterium]
QALSGANTSSDAGKFNSQNQEIVVKTGGFFSTSRDVENVIVGTRNNRPIYLKDVAKLQDGPEEPTNYVLFGYGAAEKHQASRSLESAVTISIAKRQGTNAIDVAHSVLKKVDSLKGTLIPSSVQVSVTRNYGETASEKAGELLYHMMLAVISVTILIALALGRRESMVVLVAIPVTLALTLLVFYLYGYTLNRITLFALIFSIGILVDDAIVVVENIVRHYRMPENERESSLSTAILAVDEVGNPTILATFTVIAAILPMAFVGGLMGPYMRPIPVGASAAMIFSLIIAFIVTPWTAVRIIKKGKPSKHSHDETKEDAMTRLYRRVMTPLLRSSAVRFGFFLVVGVLLLGSFALVGMKKVTVKMLPFDNKDEFQIIVDMPSGTTLE